jgi:hypothetical protein
MMVTTIYRKNYLGWGSWHPEGRMLFKMIDHQVWKEAEYMVDRGVLNFDYESTDSSN